MKQFFLAISFVCFFSPAMRAKEVTPDFSNFMVQILNEGRIAEKLNIDLYRLEHLKIIDKKHFFAHRKLGAPYQKVAVLDTLSDEAAGAHPFFEVYVITKKDDKYFVYLRSTFESKQGEFVFKNINNRWELSDFTIEEIKKPTPGEVPPPQLAGHEKWRIPEKTEYPVIFSKSGDVRATYWDWYGYGLYY